jgi:hypothetical protein
MSAVADYGLELPVRKFLLLALSVEDKKGRKGMDILHLQKVIRYFQYLRQKTDVDYSNFNLGGVSYELHENIGTLMENGLIARSDGTRIELTDEGDKAVTELRSKFDPDDLKRLVFSKQQLNDLTSDEVMFFMYMLLPETQVNSTEVSRLLKRSEEFTRDLFKKGRISAEMAADWLGIPEEDFQKSLAKLS